MSDDMSEFLALERAIAPFAEGFSVRSGNDGQFTGVYLHRNGGDDEVGIFAGMVLDKGALPHVTGVNPPEALVMAYVKPVGNALHDDLVEDLDGVFSEAHRTLLPLASPEPFEYFEDEEGALVRRRRLPEGADELTDRRLLEFCRGSLALLGQVDLLDALREVELD